MSSATSSEVFTPVPASAGTGVRALRLLRRALGPVLAMTPFTAVIAFGLGVPVVAVVYQAFRDPQGHFTTENLRLVTEGIYRAGLYNSVKLSVITSILPGVLGVFLAYAIETSSSRWLRRVVATASGVLANFGGVNLAFIFIATLGSSGVATLWLSQLHVNLAGHFSIYSFNGVAIVYMYFQLPLMVLVMTPALAGLRPAWREAAQNLGASSWRYWRHVGIPVLLPSVLGGVLLLFGSAFAAYATAAALTAGTLVLAPIQIGQLLNGNVFSSYANVGYAIGLSMLLILTVTMVLYGLVRRRASRWLR